MSQVLEKNGKLDMKISSLEQQLNETKKNLIHSDSIINELNHIKSETVQKAEDNIRLRHDLENEKARRDSLELKIDELKDEVKKSKLKLAKGQDEFNDLKHENVDLRSQLENLKTKLGLITDKSHTELEKNSALQDELSETKKKLELLELKCQSYSEKFDLLLKKYEARKLKQKNKIERLWFSSIFIQFFFLLFT